MKRVQPLRTITQFGTDSGLQQANAQTMTPLDSSDGVFAHLSDDQKLFAIAFSLSGDPAPNQHPANISDAGAEVWNALLKSSRYLEATTNKKPVQKWAICTRMFLDICHRKGVTPFRTGGRKPVSLQKMQKQYATSFNVAAKLAQHVTEALDDANLARSLDRGVWKYTGVEYRNKRFVIVLETRMRGTEKTAVALVRYLKREQHFEKTEGVVGLNHGVDGIAGIRVRTIKYPTVQMQLRLTFTKDKLLALGIEDMSSTKMLERFDAIAIAWSRGHQFHKSATVERSNGTNDVK